MVQGVKFHHSKIRKTSVLHPHRLGWIRMNLKDPISFGLNDASACRKNSSLIEIELRRRDVTVVEGDALFPLRKDLRELSIMVRIFHLDLHHLHFFPTPEFLLSDPPICYRPTPFLERVEKGEEVSFLSLCIEPRSVWIFESAEQAVLILDPEDHRRLQGIEIEKPSPDFHKFIQLLL